MSAVFNDAGKSQIADGTTITASNTANSGNTTVGVPTTTVPVKRIDPSLPKPPSDTAWYEFPSTIDTVATQLSFAPGTLVAATGGAIGAWILIAQYPTVNNQLIRFGQSGANYVGLSTAGKLSLIANSSTLHLSTASVPIGVPFWVCHASDSKSSGGTCRMGWWDNKGVQQDTFTSTSAVTNGISLSTSYIGKIAASGVAGILRYASLRANNDSNALILPPIPKDVFGWGAAA